MIFRLGPLVYFNFKYSIDFQISKNGIGYAG